MIGLDLSGLFYALLLLLAGVFLLGAVIGIVIAWMRLGLDGVHQDRLARSLGGGVAGGCLALVALYTVTTLNQEWQSRQQSQQRKLTREREQAFLERIEQDFALVDARRDPLQPARIYLDIRVPRDDMYLIVVRARTSDWQVGGDLATHRLERTMSAGVATMEVMLESDETTPRTGSISSVDLTVAIVPPTRISTSDGANGPQRPSRWGGIGFTSPQGSRYCFEARPCLVTPSLRIAGPLTVLPPRPRPSPPTRTTRR